VDDLPRGKVPQSALHGQRLFHDGLADHPLQRGSAARVPSGAKAAANPHATSTNALTVRPWVMAPALPPEPKLLCADQSSPPFPHDERHDQHSKLQTNRVLEATVHELVTCINS
jgi:hypothetical protein